MQKIQLTEEAKIVKKHAWIILYTLLLISFTVYIALETFVITRVYSVVPPQQSESNTGDGTAEDPASGAEAEGASPMITQSSYQDDHILIRVTEYREYDTSIYVADVTISSAEYLKTAFSQNAYGRNVTEKTSEIAQRNGAILAINGDYYGAQETGYVVRNGTLYRNSASNDQEDLVIYEDGSFAMIRESETTPEQLLADGAMHILSFGPALITDGVLSVSEKDEVGKARASNPRTAIGIVDAGHYLFVVSDGRTQESEGLTLYQLAQFMESLGATTAYNLDGGGSSTMYFNGEVVNNPTTSGRNISERSVSDIVYIGY